MTHQQIADALGVSRQYISEQAKKKCPTGSVEEAREWLTINSPQGFKSRAKSSHVNTDPVVYVPVAPATPEHVIDPQPTAPAQVQVQAAAPNEVIKQDGVEGNLARIRFTERWAFNRLAAAMAAKSDNVHALNRDHIFQSKQLVELEERALKLMEEKGRVVPVEDAKMLVLSIFGIIRTQLEYAPIEYGHKLNPKNHGKGQELLREITQPIIDAIKQEVDRL